MPWGYTFPMVPRCPYSGHIRLYIPMYISELTILTSFWHCFDLVLALFGPVWPYVHRSWPYVHRSWPYVHRSGHRSGHRYGTRIWTPVWDPYLDPGYGYLDPGYGYLGTGYPMGWARAIPDGYYTGYTTHHPGYTSPLPMHRYTSPEVLLTLTSTLSRFCQNWE